MLKASFCVALVVASSGAALAQSRGATRTRGAADAGASAAPAPATFSIRSLRRRGPGPDPVTLETNAYTIARFRCPPCPPNVNCTPCPTMDILSDQPQQPADASAVADTEVSYSFATDGTCMQLHPYSRYRLTVRPVWDAQRALASVEISRCQYLGMSQ